MLLDTEPWCQLRERVFDETWFLDVPVPECNQRVGKRHVKTGLTEEQAKRRVATNDSINAELITKESPGNADRIIQVIMSPIVLSTLCGLVISPHIETPEGVYAMPYFFCIVRMKSTPWRRRVSPSGASWRQTQVLMLSVASTKLSRAALCW